MKPFRPVSLLLAATLAFVLAAPCAFSSYEPFAHQDTAFADMPYSGIDTAAVDAFCERFARDPVGQYDALVALYDDIFTQRELAYIHMCQAPANAWWSSKSEQAANDFAYASDRVFLALSEALEGAHGSALRALMPEGAADGFIGYEAADDEELDGISAENALIQEYYSLPEDDSFSVRAAELYLRLISLRRKIAADAGCDSYAEYAYMQLYAREYSPEESKALHRLVKSRLAPLFVRCEQALAARQPPWDDDDVPNAEEVLDVLRSYVGGISPELTEALDFLRRNGLYAIGGGALYDAGFTTALPAYGAAFLFNRVDTRFGAFQSTIHEFGHFNAAYHDPTPMLYQYPNVDVSELQAQGLELLSISCLQDVLAGERADDRAYVALYALSQILSSVVDGCLYDEFEQSAYDGACATADDLFALETALYREYGVDRLYETDFWPYITHLFDQPFYYVSYATSALPALDLWLLSQKDRAGAVDAYLNVSAARTDAWFLDVLDDNGLCDVTDSRDVSRLIGGLETEIGALLGQKSTVAPYTVLLIAGAAAGCAAIFLLVKARRRGAA